MGLFSRFWHCISEKQMSLGIHGDCFQELLQKPKICGCPSLPTKQRSVCIRPAHAPLYFSLPLHLLKYLIKHKSRYKYSLVSIFSGTWLVQTELLFRSCLLILDWIQRHRTHGWQMATALLVLSPGRPRETVWSLKQFHLYTRQCRLPFLIETADTTDVSMSPDVPWATKAKYLCDS